MKDIDYVLSSPFLTKTTATTTCKNNRKKNPSSSSTTTNPHRTRTRAWNKQYQTTTLWWTNINFNPPQPMEQGAVADDAGSRSPSGIPEDNCNKNMNNNDPEDPDNYTFSTKVPRATRNEAKRTPPLPLLKTNHDIR